MTRTYASGYAAGRRRAHRDRVQDAIAAERERFIQHAMIAVFPSLVASPWVRTVKGQKIVDKTAADFASTARSVAEAMARQCSFHILAVAEPIEEAKS